jgi:signal transduction histidine kinase
MAGNDQAVPEIGHDRLPQAVGDAGSVPTTNPLDLEKYRLALHPANIFLVLPKPIIEQMIRGFLHKIRKGVTLLWSEYDFEHGASIIQDERLDPFDYSNPDDRAFFNKVCWEYRRACGVAKCQACDLRVAREYASGTRTGSKPYGCWLGMDDLVYPLRLGSRICGVLFAGQIVPDDNARIAQIEQNIRGEVQAPLAERLISLLHEERQAQWETDRQYAESLVTRLSEFGDMVQQILDRLYEAGRNAAEQELQRSVEAILSGDLADPDAWWAKCQRLLDFLVQLFGLAEIQLYLRDRSHYFRHLPHAEEPAQIPVGAVLSNLEPGRFYRADEKEGTRSLAKRLAVPQDTTCFYVSYAQAEGTPLTTFLVALRGQMNNEDERLFESVCRIVTQAVDYFCLVARQRFSQKEYRQNVAQVAHDFRTPLQVLVLDLQAVSQVDAIRSDGKLAARVSQSINRALGADDHVLRLLDAAVEKSEQIEMAALVTDVMDDLQALAEEHPCRLLRSGTWPAQVIVRGVRYQLQRAITNLVENAIKYSWSNKGTAARGELHSVDVRMELRPSNLLCVSISNYGIGIPAEILARLGEPGARGKVHDRRRERAGTGWGLPIAIGALEDHHGWLEATSDPADDHPRSPEEEYHRYVTTVKALLPLSL